MAIRNVSAYGQNRAVDFTKVLERMLGPQQNGGWDVDGSRLTEDDFWNDYQRDPKRYATQIGMEAGLLGRQPDGSYTWQDGNLNPINYSSADWAQRLAENDGRLKTALPDDSLFGKIGEATIGNGQLLVGAGMAGVGAGALGGFSSLQGATAGGLSAAEAAALENSYWSGLSGGGGGGAEEMFLDNWDLLADPYTMYQNPELLSYAASGPLMPPANPMAPEDLEALGLKQKAPGVWTIPDGDSLMDAVSKLGPTALSAIKNGLSTSDAMRMLGSLGAAGLGYLGARNQSDAYERLANRYMDMGAPYRSRLEQLYSNPDSFLTSNAVQGPLQQAARIRANALSTQGNPALSGNAENDINNFAANTLYSRLGEEKDRLAGYGGLTRYAAAAPGASSAAIDANAGKYNAVGAGMNDIFNPPKTMAQNMAEYKTLMQAMGG